MEMINQYWPIALFVAYLGYKAFKNYQVKMKLMPKWIENNAQLIDVRSVAEYAAQSNPKTINIPLDSLKNNVKQIVKDRPVVFVCRSGSRSTMATMMLKKMGYNNVNNGGKWQNIPNT